MKILDYAPHTSAAERAEAYERVRSERIALRRALLARDSAGYRAAINPFEGDDHDLASADLTGSRCGVRHYDVISDLATPVERRAFDRAVLRAVEVNLWILPAVRERLAHVIHRYGDNEQIENLILEGLEDALGTWRPEAGTLIKHAYIRCSSTIRSYYRGEARRRRSAGSQATASARSPSDASLRDKGRAYEQVPPEPPVDPFLRARMSEAWDGLSNLEQEVLPLLADGEPQARIAEQLGLTTWGIRRAVAGIRRAYAPLREAVAA